MTKCRRCGDPFELRCPGDRYCRRCALEVEQITKADAERPSRHVWYPKDLTGRAA